MNSNVKLYALNEMLNVFESCGRWQMMQNYSNDESQASFSSTEQGVSSETTNDQLDVDKLALLNAYLYKINK